MRNNFQSVPKIRISKRIFVFFILFKLTLVPSTDSTLKHSNPKSLKANQYVTRMVPTKVLYGKGKDYEHSKNMYREDMKNVQGVLKSSNFTLKRKDSGKKDNEVISTHKMHFVNRTPMSTASGFKNRNQSRFKKHRKLRRQKKRKFRFLKNRINEHLNPIPRKVEKIPIEENQNLYKRSYINEQLEKIPISPIGEKKNLPERRTYNEQLDLMPSKIEKIPISLIGGKKNLLERRTYNEQLDLIPSRIKKIPISLIEEKQNLPSINEQFDPIISRNETFPISPNDEKQNRPKHRSPHVFTLVEVLLIAVCSVLLTSMICCCIAFVQSSSFRNMLGKENFKADKWWSNPSEPNNFFNIEKMPNDNISLNSTNKKKKHNSSSDSISFTA